MPKHIVRISVGLEDDQVLIRKFEEALEVVEVSENSWAMEERSRRINVMS